MRFFTRSTVIFTTVVALSVSLLVSAAPVRPEEDFATVGTDPNLGSKVQDALQRLKQITDFLNLLRAH
jgi:hypothetical protein